MSKFFPVNVDGDIIYIRPDSVVSVRLAEGNTASSLVHLLDGDTLVVSVAPTEFVERLERESLNK